MAKIGPNAPCPCGRDAKLKRCCGRLHAGAPAPDAEALMRSRYSAYALGKVDYIIATTHPGGPHFRPDAVAWRAELSTFCRGTSFDGLTVHGAGAMPGGEAWVEFTARLNQDGVDASFREHSRFAIHDGRWTYFAGEAR